MDEKNHIKDFRNKWQKWTIYDGAPLWAMKVMKSEQAEDDITWGRLKSHFECWRALWEKVSFFSIWIVSIALTSLARRDGPAAQESSTGTWMRWQWNHQRKWKKNRMESSPRNFSATTTPNSASSIAMPLSISMRHISWWMSHLRWMCELG